MFAREQVKPEQSNASGAARRMHDLIQQYRQTNGSKISREQLQVFYDALTLSSLIAGDDALKLADEATLWLLQYGKDKYGQGHPLVKRYHCFRAWYLLEIENYPEAEAEANQVISADFAALDNFAGGWDDSTRIHGYETLAACILRRQPRDELTDEEFQQAEEYLRQAEQLSKSKPQHLGSPSRTRVALDSRKLRLWVELYEKWGKPELAAPWQQELKRLNP